MKKLAVTIAILAAVALGALFVLQSLIELSRPLEGAALRGDARFAFDDTMSAEPSALPTVQNFEARDRSLISYRYYRSTTPTKVKLYLVHSETSDDLEFVSLATALARDSIDVLTITLRGHGESPKRRGDTGYVGQPSDDLADLISATARPGDIVVAGGHSTGAAVAARMATSATNGRGPKIRGLIFLAPVFSPSFPASRPNLGGWLLPLKWRVAALTVQNAVGIHWSDDVIAIQYAVPANVRNGKLGFSVTTDYTWRLFKSMQMREGDGSDLRQINVPFLAITGSKDAVIYPDRVMPALKSLVDDGEFAQVEGQTHFGIVNSSQTLVIIQNWLSKLR